MSQEQIVVASVTGVDVELQIAGPGSRSYAFVIDWHIRLVLAVAWFLIGLPILNGAWSLEVPGDKDKAFAFGVLIPSLAIYFFYHPVLEWTMRGRTPGKRMAGVRLATPAGDIPGVGAVLIRNLFRVVDGLPMFYVVGLITTMVTRQHLRFGDMAAGTLLIVDHDREGKDLRRFETLAQRASLDPRMADLIDEVLQRWKDLQEDKRRELAISLLSRIQSGDAVDWTTLKDEELRARLIVALEGANA